MTGIARNRAELSSGYERDREGTCEHALGSISRTNRRKDSRKIPIFFSDRTIIGRVRINEYTSSAEFFGTLDFQATEYSTVLHENDSAIQAYTCTNESAQYHSQICGALPCSTNAL